MRPLRMEEGQVGMTRVKIKGQCIGKLPCLFQRFASWKREAQSHGLNR
jgi:hypothetical protein